MISEHTSSNVDKSRSQAQALDEIPLDILGQLRTVVFNLIPKSWSDKKLAELVRSFGKIERINVHSDTSFAWVLFDTQQSANRCKKQLCGTVNEKGLKIFIRIL